MVILRQVHEHEFLPIAAYREAYSRLVEQAGTFERAGQSGGNFHYTLTARNGTIFTEAVMSSAAQGAVLSRDGG